MHCHSVLDIAASAGVLLNCDGVMPMCAQVQLPAYLGGTVIGMSMWSILYASLGAASRQLLDGGMDMGTLFAGEPEPGMMVAGAQRVGLACDGRLVLHETWLTFFPLAAGPLPAGAFCRSGRAR